DVTGTHALANGASGIAVTGSNNQIGGTASGAANIIAFNTQNGVSVSGGIGNALLKNSIFNNGPNQLRPGIVLASNGNDNLKRPPPTKAPLSGATLTVTETITGNANTTYPVEFFANPPGSPPLTPATADQEGKVFLGSATIKTNSIGSGT